MSVRQRFESQLGSIDAHIREGRLLSARVDLVKLVRAGTIPGALLGRTANLLRRVDLNLEALKLLAKRVRPRRRELARIATPMERAEYGAALANLGASAEALEILKGVKSHEYPPALLFQAFALMGRWEYQTVVPLLRSYIEVVTLSPYERMVGEVNLVAALVFERMHKESRQRIESLLERARTEGRKLLEANLLELLTQLTIQEGKIDDARACIRQAAKLVESSSARSSIYINKWSAVIDSLETKLPIAEQPLVRFRGEALAACAWETLRDTDRHLALATGSRALATHVFFGSSASAFRRRMRGDWHERQRNALSEVERPWIWNPHNLPWQNSDTTPTEAWDIDIASGAFSGGKRALWLKPGQLPHRLLQTLVSDFYRPWSLAALHAALFTGRHFQPETSPGVVHQAVFRLKEWIRRNRLPLTIDSLEDGYRLRAKTSFAFRLSPPDQELADTPPSAAANPTAIRSVLHRAHLAFGNRAFSSHELGRVLKVSERTARRHLVEAKVEGVVATQHHGRHVRYLINSRILNS